MRWGVTPVQTAFSSIRRPAGDVAHLILSGPSVADIGYSELDLPAVMGVNGSIALRRSHPHLRFAYYAMLDAGFVSRRRDLVADVLAQDLLLFVTPEVLRGIAQLFSPDDIRCRIAVFEEVHQRAYLPRAQPEQLARTLRDDPDLVLFDAHAPIHPLGFSLDPARGLFGGGTVAYSALQLLVWLGFRTLYLHGLDLRGASVSPRFYESADARLPSALDRQFDSHIRPAFRDASRLLGARGLRIYNLSPGSALDERVSQAPLDDAETARASVLTRRAAAILVRSRPLHAHSLYQFPPGRRRRPYHLRTVAGAGAAGRARHRGCRAGRQPPVSGSLGHAGRACRADGVQGRIALCLAPDPAHARVAEDRAL